MPLPSAQKPHPAALSGRFPPAWRRAPARARRIFFRRRRNLYDAAGRVQRQTYADGSTNLFAYTLDGGGKIVQTDITHERGDIRRMVFNPAGHLLADTRALGLPEAQTTTYTRNADNLVTDLTDPLGRVTHTSYDARGNITAVTRLYGTPQAVTWSSTWHPVFNLPESVTDPLGRSHTTTYDSQGRPTRLTDPLGNSTDLAWSAEGRLIRATRYAGATPLVSSFSYDGPDLGSLTDPLGRTTTLQHDAAGRTVALTDPLGRTTRSSHDPLDRLIRSTDPQGNSTQHTWDGNGNLSTFRDAKGNTTSWTYDARNRPLTKTDPLGKTETYQYDAAGNLAFLSDRKGQVSGFSYDALNRRSQAGFGAASTVSPVYASSATLSWDAANRLTSIIDSQAGTLSRSYDDRFDALSQESGPEGSISLSYDAAGQRQSLSPSGGTPLGYTWDAAGRLTGLSQAAGTGAANPATSQSISIAYDSANRRSGLSLPNGIRIAYAWDAANQLTSITYRKADNSLIGDLGYSYDAAGQRSTIGGSLAATNLPDSVATAGVDANNRLTAWNGTALSYDDNGNLTSDGTRSYSWDERDRLVGIAGPQAASFAYDPLGRRKLKTIGGVTTKYLHDGHNPIQEKQGGAVTANLLAGPSLDEWYARTAGGQTTSYLGDALGSTLRLTDASQAILASYVYEPYGKATVSGTPGSNSLSYTGREDDGTGLYYYRARYYHPGMARFVSEDPLGLAAGQNLQGYVGGNPVSFVDPAGLEVGDGFGGLFYPGPDSSGSWPAGDNQQSNPISINIERDIASAKDWWKSKSCRFKCNAAPQPLCWALGIGTGVGTKSKGVGAAAGALCVGAKALICEWVCDDEPKICKKD